MFPKHIQVRKKANRIIQLLFVLRRPRLFELFEPFFSNFNKQGSGTFLTAVYETT